MNINQEDASQALDEIRITGGELILAVASIYERIFGKRADLAKLNLLLFLIEGDGQIRSDLMFSETPFGPKSTYLKTFVRDYPDMIKARAFGKKDEAVAKDEDARMKVELTEAGNAISTRAVASLDKREFKAISQIIMRWGAESNSEILVYICIFFPEFCRNVRRKSIPVKSQRKPRKKK